MTEDLSSNSRTGDRHDHISIGLRYRMGAEWLHLDAMSWNDVGFSFYSAEAITNPILELKRGVAHFEGAIVWTTINTSDESMQDAVLNELIIKQASHIQNSDQLHARLIKLVRVPGMVMQKTAILASLGMAMDEQKITELIRHKRQGHPMHRYGVQIDSPAWRTIVKTALDYSSVVISMEKWANGITGKPTSS